MQLNKQENASVLSCVFFASIQMTLKVKYTTINHVITEKNAE